eukprot:846341_1
MYDASEYRAIVMLGHAGYTAKVGDFFWPVMDDLKAVNKPVLYLHASDGGDDIVQSGGGLCQVYGRPLGEGKQGDSHSGDGDGRSPTFPFRRERRGGLRE